MDLGKRILRGTHITFSSSDGSVDKKIQIKQQQ